MNHEFKFEDFEFDFRNPIGKGVFGTVYKAIEKKNGKVYAIKRYSNYDLNEDEIISMSNMNKCENSIKYYGKFIDKDKIYLIMELCDYSLAQIIDEKKGNIKEINEILEQLNNAFKLLYEKKIIHRDIKPGKYSN